jgi:HD-like signal output (HDOD) protein
MLTVDAFIDSLDHLPPVPRNLVTLTQLLDRTDVHVDRVVEVIQYDPGLTAEVMRLCNSAYFGASTPASDLH